MLIFYILSGFENLKGLVSFLVIIPTRSHILFLPSMLAGVFSNSLGIIDVLIWATASVTSLRIIEAKSSKDASMSILFCIFI